MNLGKRASRRDQLSRFYTNSPVSELLISNIQFDSPRSVIDLGVGAGALLKAAFNRWQDAKFFGADVDQEAVARLSIELPFARIEIVNGMSPNLEDKIRMERGSIDVAVCNPPYVRVSKEIRIGNLFNEVGLNESFEQVRITSDLVFLAQNLRMLREGGQLGIILPDTIFSGSEFKVFRREIVSKHNILGVIQLASNSFSKTEAKTHILLLQKSNTTSGIIPIMKANKEGKIEKHLFAPVQDLEYRMDFEFQFWKQRQSHSTNHYSLCELGAEILRGRNTKKQLQDREVPFFHTSSFSDNIVSFQPIDIEEENYVFAEKGDIIMARVGKRCIGRVAFVDEGRIPITDCIYRIRIPKKSNRMQTFHYLSSLEGQDSLTALSHGVCAKVISKEDLSQLRILLK